jgi:hypothetical protein
MKRTLILPFKSRDDQGNEFDCALYRSAENICEYGEYMPEESVIRVVFIMVLLIQESQCFARGIFIKRLFIRFRIVVWN